MDKKNILSKHISSLNFHIKAINFDMNLIPQYDVKMIEEKNQDVKVVYIKN